MSINIIFNSKTLINLKCNEYFWYKKLINFKYKTIIGYLLIIIKIKIINMNYTFK